jgi:hypothetical protein
MKMKEIISSDLLNRREASAYLRICLATLDALMLPRIKIRRRVFYRRSALDQWIIQSTEIRGVQK